MRQVNTPFLRPAYLSYLLTLSLSSCLTEKKLQESWPRINCTLPHLPPSLLPALSVYCFYLPVAHLRRLLIPDSTEARSWSPIHYRTASSHLSLSLSLHSSLLLLLWPIITITILLLLTIFIIIFHVLSHHYLKFSCYYLSTNSILIVTIFPHHYIANMLTIITIATSFAIT